MILVKQLETILRRVGEYLEMFAAVDEVHGVPSVCFPL